MTRPPWLKKAGHPAWPTYSDLDPHLLLCLDTTQRNMQWMWILQLYIFTVRSTRRSSPDATASFVIQETQRTFRKAKMPFLAMSKYEVPWAVFWFIDALVSTRNTINTILTTINRADFMYTLSTTTYTLLLNITRVSAADNSQLSRKFSLLLYATGRCVYDVSNVVFVPYILCYSSNYADMLLLSASCSLMLVLNACHIYFRHITLLTKYSIKYSERIILWNNCIGIKQSLINN